MTHLKAELERARRDTAGGGGWDQPRSPLNGGLVRESPPKKALSSGLVYNLPQNYG